MSHHCHWPGCRTPVPPKLWGCKQHWFMLPKRLRDTIWRTYVPGQEITKTPSPEYIAVAKDVQAWIAGTKNDGGEAPKPEEERDIFSEKEFCSPKKSSVLRKRVLDWIGG